MLPPYTATTCSGGLFHSSLTVSQAVKIHIAVKQREFRLNLTKCNVIHLYKVRKFPVRDRVTVLVLHNKISREIRARMQQRSEGGRCSVT